MSNYPTHFPTNTTFEQLKCLQNDSSAKKTIYDWFNWNLDCFSSSRISQVMLIRKYPLFWTFFPPQRKADQKKKIDIYCWMECINNFLLMLESIQLLRLRHINFDEFNELAHPSTGNEIWKIELPYGSDVYWLFFFVCADNGFEEFEWFQYLAVEDNGKRPSRREQLTGNNICGFFFLRRFCFFFRYDDDYHEK